MPDPLMIDSDGRYRFRASGDGTACNCGLSKNDDKLKMLRLRVLEDNSVDKTL